MKVCISGGGIAGLTLAWWLQRDGHDVVVAERRGGVGTEGFMIDFFGSGWDVAERMGLIPRLEAIHYPIPELAFVRPDGQCRKSFPYARMRKLFSNRHFNFMRGDLERVLYEALPEGVDVRFGCEVATVGDVEAAGGVEVSLSDGSSDRYDLVVGADGIHSHLRRLVFGAGEEVERFLDFYTAAYVIDDAEMRKRVPDGFRTLTVPRRQVALYPIRHGRLATLFVYEASVDPQGKPGAPGETLRRVFGDLAWLVPEILEKMPADGDIYFDSVSQVIMDRWSRGRAVLVGDACQAVSLLAGQGASMALGGAWALATALREESGVEAALARYERMVRPAIVEKQKAGRRMAAWFVPRSRIRIGFRDFFLGLSLSPGMSWMLRRVVSGDSIVSPGPTVPANG